MLISLIVAMAQNRCIGNRGQLPWHLPGDLQRFKQLTMGHSLLMGRGTFESIGRPLPGRSSCVLSRDPLFSPRGCQVYSDLEQALDGIARTGENELFICGGADIYRQLLARCKRIYLTELERKVTGDCFFPEIQPGAFKVVRRLRLFDREPVIFSLLERTG